MKWLVVFAALFVVPAHAQQVGVSVTYAKWETLNPSDRVFYMSGTLDGMIMFARAELSSFFYECLRREKLSVQQLTSEVEGLAKSSPDVKERTVQEALLTVLKMKCGR
jgi:hypothetical protein